MKPRHGAILALVFLATCSEEPRDPSTAESSRAALGVSPPSETAIWQRVGSANTPEGRYLQAAAYDETRKVIVMFGGQVWNPSSWTGAPNDETWEWSPATGKWLLRASPSGSPDPRSGAAMVFDAKRNKLVLFGGRAGSGFDFEDTWELDAATGAWTNVSGPGTHPSARSQHAMVYEHSTGKIFLFGGGRSDPYSSDGTGITVSLGDAWELDPETHTWTAVAAPGPSGRHAFGMAWDSSRDRVVLSGGMQTDIPNASGVPKQDTWEYDPASGTWTERTLAGTKPSQRYAHAMAFDGNRGRAVVFGGWDISTGYFLNDLWDWDPATGIWTERVADGASNAPPGRLFASLVAVDASARLELVAGAVVNDPYGGGGMVPMPVGYYGVTGTREIWELDPVTATFVDRTAPLDLPSERGNHAMAYNPATGKSYLFGGYEAMRGTPLDDLWEWNGTTWELVPTSVRPPARGDAALAYDPARKSLILFGGTNYLYSEYFSDTWEWTGDGGWTQLRSVGDPGPLSGHAMVTDTVRGKILLFGGVSSSYWYNGPDGGMGPMKDPMRNEIWEWDGAQQTWTNRTPTTSASVPMGRQYPIVAFDEARQKLFVFDGYRYGGSATAFWEWDTLSAGWSLRDTGEWLDKTYGVYAVYDSIRRREILFTDSGYGFPGKANGTWELDARGPTWYVRTPSGSPDARYNAAMVFDRGRGVAVLFGGISSMTGMWMNDTWEYRVTGWGNGTGCTSSFATSCASGNCVDGVCCDAAACTGPCQSCNVAGSEGACLPVKAGTEVPGSCANGQACDGNGKCMSSNGQPCTSASTCASGSCTDGVCCDTPCTGLCVSCANSGQVGKCTPYAAGTDPQNECGKGTGLCRSTCDGVGDCVFPSTNQPCASCTVCDGNGNCSVYDPFCSFAGAGGSSGFGGSGGYTTARGGSGGTGGYTTARGGSGGTGGYYTTARGGSGGTGGYYTTARGGSGGTGGYYTTVRGGSGGSGGYTTVRGGSGGSGGYTTVRGGSGGYTTVRGGSGGYTTSYGGSIGSGGSGGKRDAGSPKGGSTGGNPDAGALITTARLHRSGCDCAVGQARSGAAGLAFPLFIAGTALLVLRRRRR